VRELAGMPVNNGDLREPWSTFRRLALDRNLDVTDIQTILDAYGELIASPNYPRHHEHLRRIRNAGDWCKRIDTVVRALHQSGYLPEHVQAF
jgi:hypothetical protein